MKPWVQRHGTWRSGPFTIRLDLDPRTKVVVYELYDSTRFAGYFESPNYAMRAAENLNSRAQEKAS